MRKGVSVFVGLSALGCAAARADVKLPEIFADRMVLQSGKAAAVWGTAEPKEMVFVSFAGHTKTAWASDRGEWKVVLGPLEALAEPRTLTVKGKNTVALKDVRAGEAVPGLGPSEHATVGTDGVPRNLNACAGTVSETLLTGSDCYLTQQPDTDSPFKGLLANATVHSQNQGATITDNGICGNSNVNTICASWWLNTRHAVPQKAGIRIRFGCTARFTDNSSVISTINFFLADLAAHTGQFTTNAVNDGLMTATARLAVVDAVGDWVRVVGYLNDIAWKAPTNTLASFKIMYDYCFIESGYTLSQNNTFLAGKDIAVNLDRTCIYPDGLNQLRHPYALDDSVRNLLALKAKQQADVGSLLAGNGNSPLTGKKVVFVADSLGASCGRVNPDGVSVTQERFPDLPPSDQDRDARMVCNRHPAHGSTESDGVGYPYWIAKATHCKVYDLMQPGWKMVNAFAVLPKGWSESPLRYTNIGKVYDLIYSGSTLNRVDVLETYTPDYIIFSFGTNDNTDLGRKEAMIGEDINSFSPGFEWDTSTVWGAWNKVLIYCMTKFPFAKIGIISDGSTIPAQKEVFKALASKYGCGFLDLQDASATPALYYNAQNLKSKNSPTPLSVAKRKLRGCAKSYEIGEGIYNFYDHKLNLLSYDVLGSGTNYNPSVHSTLECHKLKASMVLNWILTL